MVGFLLAFVLTIVAMLFVERVRLRVIYRDELIIRIYFLVFELILYPARNKKRRRKRRGVINEIRKGLASINATRLALEYIFSHSRVTVRELRLKGIPTDDPARLALAFQRKALIITLILSYLFRECGALVTESAPSLAEDSKSKTSVALDADLDSTLLRIISSFVIYRMNLQRYKIKRRRKIV